MKFYIFNNSIPSEKGMSGSDRRAIECSKYFKKSGHDVILILPRIGLRRYHGTGVKFLTTDNSPYSHKPSFGLFLKRIKAAKKVCKYLRLGDSDVIYSSSDLIADSIPALSLKKGNIKAKFICGLHLIAPNPFKGFENVFSKRVKFPGLRDLYYYFTQKIIISHLKKYANLVLVSNNHDKDTLVKQGFANKQVAVAYGGIDKELLAQAHSSDKKYDAVFVGRLHKQKGFYDLVRIVSLIAQRERDFRLALISDIPETELMSILERNNIKKNIVFFGFKDGIDKFLIIKQSKLLIFPSYYESFGIVICEAMACGLPVVAYDLPIYKEIYPEGIIKAGIGNIEELANGVLDLLTNEKKLRHLSKVALNVSKRFSWGRTGESILLSLV